MAGSATAWTARPQGSPREDRSVSTGRPGLRGVGCGPRGGQSPQLQAKGTGVTKSWIWTFSIIDTPGVELGTTGGIKSQFLDYLQILPGTGFLWTWIHLKCFLTRAFQGSQKKSNTCTAPEALNLRLPDAQRRPLLLAPAGFPSGVWCLWGPRSLPPRCCKSSGPKPGKRKMKRMHGRNRPWAACCAKTTRSPLPPGGRGGGRLPSLCANTPRTKDRQGWTFTPG